MSFKALLILFLCGLAVAVATAWFQSTPGYMDADYYYAAAVQLVEGKGFSEPFLWNYLDDPTALPHPSHLYWMPLASVLAAASIKISGLASFQGASLVFIILAASLPPLTARFAFHLTKRPELAMLSGWMAVFSGFYLPYFTTTDTFAITMVMGALFLWFTASPRKALSIDMLFLKAFGMGILAGMMHLGRADGMMWLGFAWISVLSEPCEQRGEPDRWRIDLAGLMACLAGYLLIMAPWMWRNYTYAGTFLSPGASRGLWLRQYDELFYFPASRLSAATWLESGFLSILRARLDALSQNFQTALAVQGSIVLFPLILMGGWAMRSRRPVWIGGLAWLAIFGLMTLVFPFQGARGGFFHSGAALQPLLWTLAPIGLEISIQKIAQFRRWNPFQAYRFFAPGLVAILFFMTLFLAERRIIGGDFENPLWNRSAVEYAELEAVLETLDPLKKESVMVNNPPGYYLASQRQSIATPYGGVEVLIGAAQRFGVRYLLLEKNHPEDLHELYDHPQDTSALDYWGSIDGTRVYIFQFAGAP